MPFRRLLYAALISIGLLAPAMSVKPVDAQALKACAFTAGFQVIHDAMPALVGACMENEQYGPRGDSQQRTTTGLLAWRKADNWSAFTDGYRTWVNGPYGLAVRLNTERFPWEAPTQGPLIAPAPTAASVGPLGFVNQSINNCGPAAISTVLEYWGVHQNQEEIAQALRADGDPNGMVAFGMPAYIRGLGLASILGVEGTDELLKALIANGFPVIVDQWVSPEVHWEHYRVVQAYDDKQGVFIANDPYLGPDLAIGYKEFDELWQSDNQRFYVIYPSAKHGLLAAAASAAGWHPVQAYTADAAESNLSAQVDPGGGFGPGYDLLNAAWDELELGNPSRAEEALRAAEKQGANQVQVGWIAEELTLRQRAKIFW